MTDFRSAEAEVLLTAKTGELVGLAVATLIATREVGEANQGRAADIPEALVNYLERIDTLAREYWQSKK